MRVPEQYIKIVKPFAGHYKSLTIFQPPNMRAVYSEVPTNIPIHITGLGNGLISRITVLYYTRTD